MRRLLEISVRPDRRFREAADLVAQWSARTKRLLRLVPLLSAEYVCDDILGRIPPTEEWRAYRTSLHVVEVKGLPPGVAAYVLRSSPKGHKLGKVDASRTVLYIRSKRRSRRTHSAISTLERFSPWTLPTIPFMPRRSEAIVISRRVGRSEVQQVTKQRLKDRPRWRRELNRAGHREVRKDLRLRAPTKAHAIPDVAFQALRLEFGLGGTKPRPHWRPAIRKLATVGLRAMLRQDRRLRKLLMQVGYRGWRNLPPRLSHKIRMSEVQHYLPFQRKLRIRL